MFSRWRCNLLLLLVAIAFSSVEAFQPSAAPGNSASRSLAFVSMGQRPLFMQNPAFDDDEEEEDGRIDPDLLGDWRDFRRNLAANPERQETTQQKEVRRSVSTENEHVLKSQSQDLAFEYTSGVWAHVTATVRLSDRCLVLYAFSSVDIISSLFRFLTNFSSFLSTTTARSRRTGSAFTFGSGTSSQFQTQPHGSQVASRQQEH